MSLSARNWAWDVNTRGSYPGEVSTRGVSYEPGTRLPIRPGEKLTLLCLAEMENAEYGYAFPSMSTIAASTGQSTRTVQTHIDSLERMNAIRREKRRGTRGTWLRNVYVLTVPETYREKDPEWQRWARSAF